MSYTYNCPIRELVRDEETRLDRYFSNLPEDLSPLDTALFIYRRGQRQQGSRKTNPFELRKIYNEISDMW